MTLSAKSSIDLFGPSAPNNEVIVWGLLALNLHTAIGHKHRIESLNTLPCG